MATEDSRLSNLALLKRGCGEANPILFRQMTQQVSSAKNGNLERKHKA